MTQFKVGDRVRVKPNTHQGELARLNGKEGQVVRVRGVVVDLGWLDDEPDWTATDWMDDELIKI